MANSISGAVWRIDTAPFSYAFPVKVENLNITDATAADHVVMKDSAGRTLVDFTANSAELDYRIGKLGWVNGLSVASGGLGTSAVITIAVGAGK
jgi:hypothetical protein